MARPAAGCPAIASATARLASVTGVGSYRASSPYNRAIWGQSVSAGTEWQAAMAACS